MTGNRKKSGYQLGITVLLVTVKIFTTENCAVAQITPDNTLGGESTKVNPNGNIGGLPSILVESGAIRDVNLFHSFLDFNVGEGQRVYFANPTGIENIFSRVTGANSSNILGTLGVNGGANLFLLNPNGILFGPNAKLDISASFSASTAEGFDFGNGIGFSATNPNAAPLIRLDFQPGLQYGTNYRGNIVNSGNLAVGFLETLSLGGNSITSTGSLTTPGGLVNLQANTDITLQGAVINTSADIYGGDIFISAPGRVSIIGSELTSRGNNSNDNITADFYSTIGIAGGSVLIDGGSLISTTNFGTGLAGDVRISGQDGVEVLNGSSLFSQGREGRVVIDAPQGSVLLDGAIVKTSNTGEGEAGDVFIDAQDQITINNSEINSLGDFGRIFIGVSSTSEVGNVTAPDFPLPATIEINNSMLDTTTVDPSDRGGRMGIFASQQVNVTGGKLANRSISSDVSTDDYSRIVIFARNGSVSVDGTTVSTTNSGVGFAGDVTITARDLVQINNSRIADGRGIFSKGYLGRIYIGASGDADFSPARIVINNSTFSTDNSSVVGGGKINAGGVSVRANESIALNDAQIYSSTSREGNAGAVFIVAPGGDITLDNSDIFSNAERGAIGDGGLVDINTRLLFVLNGSQVQTIVRGASDPSTEQPGQGNAGVIIINADDEVRISGTNSRGEPSAIFSAVGAGAVGNGGNILISTKLLEVSKGGGITVDNFGLEGAAGNIIIGSEFIVLDRNAQIRALALSGQGGNVALISPNLVGVSRNSFISTTSGSPERAGGGGNILIQDDNDGRTLFVYGFPLNNNDITAEAFAGDGGKINITSSTIRNLAFRPQTSERTNDISTRSLSGVSGETTIDTLNLDPDRGVASLPSNFAERPITEGCDPRVRQGTSNFQRTGRGGLRPTADVLTQETLATNPVSLPSSTPSSRVESPPVAASTQPLEIVPAQGWVVNAQGRVILTANSTTVSPVNIPSFSTPAGCHAPLIAP